MPFALSFRAWLPVAALALLALPAGARAQGGPPTTDLSFLATQAEASDYRETTRYDAVRAFVGVLADVSGQVHQTDFGYSVEGRPLPLVVFGDVPSAAPADVRTAGREDGREKVRLFVMAGIHAGEAAGKEAALMLLRKLAAGRHAAWADSLVVLVAPLYNADGNEEVSLYHRPYQLGPVGGMGARYNAQGLDLNRDHTKLDSPEAHALARLLDAYDPHAVIDLHTTNGTHHGYHLTYAPPLHPSAPASVTRLLREEWLPDVQRTMRAEHRYETGAYGVVGRGYYDRGGPEAERGWYTFSHQPRFSNNYVGLRGRFGILAEAYAYAPFETRVLSTLRFVEEVAGWAYRHAAQVHAHAARADEISRPGTPVALRAEHARTDAAATVLIGAVDTLRHPYTGRPLYERRDSTRRVQMPAYLGFRPSERTRLPAAYLVPDSLDTVRERLDTHGVRYRVLPASRPMQVEQFVIDSVRVAASAYQDRRAHTYFGRYRERETRVSAGTLVVPARQPLGVLAGALLEPRSDDGFARWGFFDGLEAGGTYPVLRQVVGPAEATQREP